MRVRLLQDQRRVRLHSDILKRDVFHDAYARTPDKFTNVTNGIDHRRWLSQINPKLDALVRECTGGDDYLLHPDAILGLEKYKNDKAVLERLEAIKKENKRRFASYLARESGVMLNTDAIFDVQVKRLHEYKRQLLNVLHIVHLYNQLRDNPNMEFTPHDLPVWRQGGSRLSCCQADHPAHQLPVRSDQCRSHLQG